MAPTPPTIDPTWAWQPFEPSRESEWNLARAAHLYRRAAFGGTRAELAAAIKLSPSGVVTQLVRGSADAAASRADEDAFAQSVLATNDPRQLAAWWVYVLLSTKHPFVERMTLLWHSHFATSAEKVTDAKAMFVQNRVLREHALGDFRPLVHAISRDPAMLVYLDSATNRKGHPNENFARELMELFCLGEGHYSEKDVQELARCFTGWEIKLGRFRFNRFQHDAGTKLLLGKTAPFEDGAAVDWILDQPQAARFIVGKLYREFVCDEPEPAVELIEPLAIQLRVNNWQIAPVVERILGSQLFFSEHAMGRKVRSPADAAIGLLRSLEGTTNAHQLATDLAQNGQSLFYPPNVKGWDGGRAWINSSTILGRTNMMTRLINDEKTRFGARPLHEYVSQQLGASEPDQVVDTLAALLLAVPLPQSTRESLTKICKKPNDGPRGTRDALQVLVALPEFQLC
jgi:uncharacterized protein (DUF1800 family)